MRIAITDANIFIDLIKLQLLGYLFSIDIEIYTTTEIVDQLNDHQYEKIAQFIQAKLLIVYNFSGEELLEITELECPRALEFPDKTVFYLAGKIKAEVLTGDGPLRKFCSGNQLTVRGIIWLFDIFLSKDLISPSVAVDKMNQLLSFNNRLPKEDCMSRLKQWQERNG